MLADDSSRYALHGLGSFSKIRVPEERPQKVPRELNDPYKVYGPHTTLGVTGYGIWPQFQGTCGHQSSRALVRRALAKQTSSLHSQGPYPALFCKFCKGVTWCLVASTRLRIYQNNVAHGGAPGYKSPKLDSKAGKETWPSQGSRPCTIRSPKGDLVCMAPLKIPAHHLHQALCL